VKSSRNVFFYFVTSCHGVPYFLLLEAINYHQKISSKTLEVHFNMQFTSHQMDAQNKTESHM